MVSDLLPKEDCPQMIETITNPSKFPTFLACGELPEIPKSYSLLSLASGTTHSVAKTLTLIDNIK